ncbi:MAG TPA: sensor domain-containing phosphodiesterase [Spirochaetales bacterium]|nr:sensor domain-containing phosphodiesterase [Spirochaetales bacterium]
MSGTFDEAGGRRAEPVQGAGIGTERPDVGTEFRLARRLLDLMPDGAFFADDRFTLAWTNPALGRVAGLPSFELVAASIDALFPESDHEGRTLEARNALATLGHWRGVIRRRDRRGAARGYELAVSALRDEAGRRWYAGHLRDLSSVDRARERLEYSASHDALTGLPNRELFSSGLETLISAPGRPCFAVALIDLDNFKRINTELSREDGDRILKAVAERLSAAVRSGDFLARSGGDEFSLIVRLERDQDGAEAAARILGAFSAPFEVSGKAIHARASMGLARFPEHGTDARTLMANADLALQASKDRGRSALNFYRPDIDLQLRDRAFLEDSLRDALERSKLSVHYQPVIDVSSGELVSVEALARWYHAGHGSISPERFIPVAESSGMIGELGEQVLRTACRQGGAWSCAGGPDLRVAFNVSPIQLKDPGFVDSLAAALLETGVDPSRLSIEITESTICDDLEDAARVLARIKALGISISVDDFGTGYSSLAYIKNLPVDVVKIDREFIRDIETNERAFAIVESVVRLSHEMGIKVIAEGVENPTQFELLRTVGCDCAQGFLFSRALPASELEYLFFG